MNYQANQLRRAIEEENEMLRHELIGLGYLNTPDGIQLHELTNSELKQIFENERARKGADEDEKEKSSYR